ncbi:MAG: PilT/PilU family type 4a pilus ATPase [Candidatus Absconditabacteria bacterium]
MLENSITKNTNRILDYFLKDKSPDLHLSSDKVFIRNKIGDLEKVDLEISSDIIYDFAKVILSNEKYEALKKGMEIDYGYSYKGERFRMNFYQDQSGINVAIRRLSTIIPNIKQINLPENLNDFYLKNKGLILVTGPTGSGKSTTLASIVKYISEKKKCHIITLEDPIEYVLESETSLINQREVGNNTKSWLDGIKYALRQDPDVVVVGEMRDLETIEAVLTLVETGHLVISTLHTIDAVQTITRIINSFGEAEQSKIAVQLSMVLELIISQRLLPAANGKGRYCAREILINNSASANLIRQNKIPHLYGIIETQRRLGMQTMDQSLAMLVATGSIDKYQALSIVANKEVFEQMVGFYLEKQHNDSKVKN